MTIREPILAFTLTRLQTRPAHEPSPPPPSDDELNRRLQDGTAADEIARVAGLGKGSPGTEFDYAGVPTENVAEINKLVSRIRAAHKRHLEAVYEIGADLLRAKELLGHGNFLPWLQAEFRWSERTANNYMSIARFFQGKTANFADLGVGTAAALAARSTPAEIRNELLARAEAGESISREEVRERLALGRQAQLSAKTAANKAGLSDAASIGESRERFAPPPAIIERLNSEEFVRTAPAMRPILPMPLLAGTETAGAASDSDGRQLIDAMLEIDRLMERLSPVAPAQAAEMLLAAQNEHELPRVRKAIGFILQVKQALDDKDGAKSEPELRRAS